MLYFGLVSAVACVLLVAISPVSWFSCALVGLAGLQGGYMNSSKSNDSIRIDLRPQMWQLTSMAVCCGLVSFVVCVLFVVAIPAVSWFFWRSCGPERSVGWL